MPTYGYVRVSTSEQHTDRQLTNIKKFRPLIDDDYIFIDHASGKDFERAHWTALRRIMKKGDELIVSELDRLGRTKSLVKDELDYLKKRGVKIRALDVPTTLIDFEGQEWVLDLVSQILIETYTALAEHEISQKRERQRQGIEEARKKGIYRGRKPIQIDPSRMRDIYTRWRAGTLKAVEAQSLLGIKANTFYRHVHAYEQQHKLGKHSTLETPKIHIGTQ